MSPLLRRPCPQPRRPRRRALAGVGCGKKNFRPERRRNPLKGLKADKGIQGDPSIFLGWILLDCASAWIGLAKFGSVGSFGVSGLAARQPCAKAILAPAIGVAVEAG